LLRPEHSPQAHDHRFQNAESWARGFDDPARDARQMSHQVMAPKGTVYAVDVEPDM
jgi:hypothetical protein